MVELELLEKVQRSGEYPNLLTSTDVDNIKLIVESNPSLFAYPWYDKRSNRRDCGVAISKTLGGSTLYGFGFDVVKQNSVYKLWDNHILRSNLFAHIFDSKIYFYDPSDPSSPEEEHISFDSVPIFQPSINMICGIASEITGRQSVGDLQNLLQIIQNVEELDDLDYTLTYMRINRKRQTIKFDFEKNDNNNTFTDIVESLTSEGSIARINCSGLAGIVASEILSDENTTTSMTITYGPGGLSEEISFSLSTIWSKLAAPGTSPQDNYTVFRERSVSHTNFVHGTSNMFTNQNWITSDISNEISTWEDNTILENIYAVTTISASESGVGTELIYGFSGPKNGKQPS